MIRVVAGLLVLLVVGFPLLVAPASATGLLGLVAVTLCAGGIISLSTSLLAAGAGLAIVEYAFALLVAGGPPDFLGALAFGVVLSLLLQTVGFAARFRGASVDPRVVREQARAWVATATAAAAVGTVLAMGAGAVGIGLPPAAYPAAAAFGALMAVLGVVGRMVRSTEPLQAARGQKER